MIMFRNETHTSEGRGDKRGENPYVRHLTKIFLENRSVPQKIFGEK